MKTLNVFISYCHKDDALINEFRAHIQPLQDNKTVNVWYDKKINAGDDFQQEIDNKLENADVVCLMLSHNFFASAPCTDEKNIAMKLKREKGITVIPIILTPCSWTENADLKKLLAAPTDGKSVTSFSDQNEGWVNVVTCIKNTCQAITQIMELKITDEFESFLNGAELLAKSHKDKTNLQLKDIFVFPKLTYYDDKETTRKYDSANLATEILEYNKIMLAGENQSGKTTLCKELFKIYRKLNFVPVYLNKHIGSPINNIQKAFAEQYQNIGYDKISITKIVPIIDDFHITGKKERDIEQYQEFPHLVLVVDEIFGLDVKNQTLIQDYKKFEIREFTPLERDELIRKWILINENDQVQANNNHLQQRIDERTEIIENTLGITFGKGIMPSYPFFILALLSAQDTQKPLDAGITSQGYCYQALIYMYLRKEGIKDDQIDLFMNFLAELAFWLYEKKSAGLTHDELVQFEKYYKSHFNIGSFNFPHIIATLLKINICTYDSLNQYHFNYDYLYYFFIAKYLAEHITEKKDLIDNILENLHKNENAYITIFITHHTKSNCVLDPLLANAQKLFQKYPPATLTTKELSSFDKHQEQIANAVLPSSRHDVAAERKKIMDRKTQMEEDSRNQPSDDDSCESELMRDLRRGIKTVEVMGLIIKNRSGSLPLEKLHSIFIDGLNVHLRIMSSFLEIVQNEESEQEIVTSITERLNQTDKNRNPTSDEIKDIARKIYWHINFGVLMGLLTKSIHSLGSNNLIKVVDDICTEINTPAAFIVNHGVKMWYGKNIKIQDIADRMDEKDFSRTAEKLMRYKICQHCYLHKITYKDLQRIQRLFKLPHEWQKSIVAKGNSQSETRLGRKK